MRLMRLLRRIRNSTWVLAVIFVAALVTYAMVKPAQANSGGDTPATVQPAASRTASPPRSPAKPRPAPLAERTKSATPTPVPQGTVRPSQTATPSPASVPATSTTAATPAPSATGSAAQTSASG